MTNAAATAGPGGRRPGAGRPRDEEKTPQIMAAVAEVLGEVGYGALRVPDVAARAGVSLGSVYRRWPTKQDLVVAAIAGMADPLSLGDTGDARTDFVTLLTEIAEGLADPRRSRFALLAADRDEPEVATAAREHMPAIRQYLHRLLAERLGSDHPALDLLVDVGPALVWYRSLVWGEDVDAAALAEELTAQVVDRLAGPRSAGGVAARPSEPVLELGDAGRPVRRDLLRNRRRIVAAAQELFAERRFNDVQLEDVAARAGVSRATLVRHIGTKQQLADEVYHARVRDLAAVAEEALALPDPWEAVVHLVTIAGRMAYAQRGLYDYVDSLDAGRPLPVRQQEQTDLLYQRLEAVFARAYAAGVLAVELTPGDLFPLLGSAMAAATLPDGGDRLDLYLTVVLRGLRAG